MSTILLIPGVLCDRRLWSAQIAGLSQEHDVVVADITQQATIAAMATTVLATAPARFSLAGFSLGSQVALQIMCTAGERVERLALLSATHGGLLPPSVVAFHQAIATIEQGRFEEYLETTYLAYVAPRRAQDQELRDIFMVMAHSVGEEAGLRQMRALLALTAPFSKLDKILCPTLVIGGREDRRTTPAAHETLAREIHGAELILIDDSGHFTTLERPGAVTQALQRWAANSA